MNTGALDGIRILDFTWVRAGPWATRWLASLGAQVIKIEWPANLDLLRQNRYTVPPNVEVGPNSTGQFADSNVGKFGLSINVRTAKGLDIIKDLISISDVVIENFSSTVMQRWGLSYDQMRLLKPDIIYVSMAGFGQRGRNHSYTTMGPSAQALSGMTFLSGLPGQPPAGWGWSYLDDTGGMYGANCVLTALFHRSTTGNGQHVDLSQMAIGPTLNGAAFLDKTVNGRNARREGYPPGNRSVWPDAPVLNNYRGPIACPHNAYQTKGGGYNDWCVIVCQTDEEWQRLVAVMRNPEWAMDPDLDFLSGRLHSQEEIDHHIETWTLNLDKYEVMQICQDAGVRCMPVQSSLDRVEHDPQLRHRGIFSELVHPTLGLRKHQNAPFKMSKTPAQLKGPAPLLGQHTQEVLQNLLGLNSDELQGLYTDGTLWPKDIPIPDYIES